jgi:hypothetical protein
MLEQMLLQRQVGPQVRLVQAPQGFEASKVHGSQVAVQASVQSLQPSLQTPQLKSQKMLASQPMLSPGPASQMPLGSTHEMSGQSSGLGRSGVARPGRSVTIRSRILNVATEPPQVWSRFIWRVVESLEPSGRPTLGGSMASESQDCEVGRSPTIGRLIFNAAMGALLALP